MPYPPFHQTCACPCGASQLVITAKPRVRYLCHCTICQAVYRQPYSDSTPMRADQVSLVDGHQLQFKEHRKPPAVSRGQCSACAFPLVGFMNPAPFMRLAFVASAAYPDASVLPPPRMHIYYHRRVADVNDAVPKYSGPLRSQIAALPLMFSTMFGGPKRA